MRRKNYRAPVVDKRVDPSKHDASLRSILEQYELIEVIPDPVNPFVVVTERTADKQFSSGDIAVAANQDLVLLRELGSSSPSPFTSWTRMEYNPKLFGLEGLRTYDRMRKSDGVVRGSLRAIKTPILAARWFVSPEDPQKTVDKTAADFVYKQLTEFMSISWQQILCETALMCEFGYYMFEKVWEERVIDGTPRLIWSKLAPRHPMDVVQWHYDSNGGPLAVEMYPASMKAGDPNVIIPIDKLLVFTFDREAGNIEGISVLRSAHKHWYYKDQLYKIDAIQKERHGIGIPVIKLPPGFSKDDKSAANELGRNLRTNERAHVVLPPNWDLVFARLEGHPVDSLASIAVHDDAIRENILASFMGSKLATREEDQTLFLKATRFIADGICDTFNKHAIQQLVEYNFKRAGTPQLRARRIGEQADWRTISFAIRNLIGAGVIRPDDKLEDHMRDEMDLPPVDEKTLRVTGDVRETVAVTGGQPNELVTNSQGEKVAVPPQVPTAQKQDGMKAGMPRQTPKPPVGKPAKNSGVDRSGG